MKITAFKVGGAFTSVVGTTRFINLAAPVMLLIACASIYFAFTQVRSTIAVGKESLQLEKLKLSPPQLTQNPLTKEGYIEIARIMTNNNPVVKIEPSKDFKSLLVSIADASNLPEWSYALSTIQSEKRGLLWSANRLCLQKCEGGVVIAELRAYTQEIALPKQ